MYEEYNTFMAAYERAEEKEIMHGLGDTLKAGYGKAKAFGKKQWDYTKAGASALKGLGDKKMRAKNASVQNIRSAARVYKLTGDEGKLAAANEKLKAVRQARTDYAKGLFNDDAKKGLRNMGIAGGAVAATAGGAVAITKAVKKAKARKRAKQEEQAKK